ncbi:MAG TPA: L,D-transpeptidase family protein [Steroidobacteraceae bacterium]|nr:L,D-transpeptidase family protein [Steroidobacteraceae bacterium]
MRIANPAPIWLLLLCLSPAPPVGAGPEVAGPGGAAQLVIANRELADRLTALARSTRLSVAGEALASQDALPLIYAATGGRLLWQDPARRTELLETVRGVAADGLLPEDYHLDVLSRLAADRVAQATPAAQADFDVLATDAYVLVLYHLYLGKVDPIAIEPNWNLPQRTLRERDALGFVEHALEAGTIRETAAALRPKHWLYEHGRAALARYRALAAQGGWQPLPAGRKLEPGSSDPRVPELRRRLTISGDYQGPASDSPQFDAPLAAGLRVFQQRHLLTPDGMVGAATLRELNVPVGARVDQLRINLERGRWVLHDIGDEDLVVVDIAGYGVRYLRNQHSIWRARAIVGQQYRQTPVFRAQIENVVFNPTWTVPPGILARDVLPQMQRGENVLARKKLEVYDRNGRPVDPATIAWAQYTARTFPYVLRQAAGDDNALGRVKINFPNPYLVYLHDTPTRSLFDKDDRTFSSGCIRVERPLELVELLLADPVRWNAAAIRAAVDSPATHTVTLPHNVPVLLMYWTADEDPDGRTVFKRDVYHRDARLLRALDGRVSVAARKKT